MGTDAAMMIMGFRGGASSSLLCDELNVQYQLETVDLLLPTC